MVYDWCATVMRHSPVSEALCQIQQDSEPSQRQGRTQSGAVRNLLLEEALHVIRSRARGSAAHRHCAGGADPPPDVRRSGFPVLRSQHAQQHAAAMGRARPIVAPSARRP